MPKQIYQLADNKQDAFAQDLKNLSESYFNTPSDSPIKSVLTNTDSPGLVVNSPMVPLTLLDSAEVKNDKCPTCKTSQHLMHNKGFRICPYCNSIYKIWNGQSYKVLLTDKDEQMSINEMVLRNIGMNRLFDNR